MCPCENMAYTYVHLLGLASECHYIENTLHCALVNGADLYVNKRQKIRHYCARSTEERRMPNHDFLLRVVRT